jgi:hypothetical protein
VLVHPAPAAAPRNATTEATLAELAREHCALCLNVLAQIAGNADVVASTRVSAAVALLDRGWGKPAQVASAEAQAPVIKYDLTLDDVIAARAEILDEC